MTDDEVEAELARLARLVEEMKAQVDAARLAEAPTMRARLRCPGCHATRIAHARHVLDRGDGDARKVMALNQPSWWSDKLVGEVEAYACCACGLVEWYVKDPSGLREVKGQIEILDGETPRTGAYR